MQSLHYIPIHYAIFEATPIQDWHCILQYIAIPMHLFQPCPEQLVSKNPKSKTLVRRNFYLPRFFEISASLTPWRNGSAVDSSSLSTHQKVAGSIPVGVTPFFAPITVQLEPLSALPFGVSCTMWNRYSPPTLPRSFMTWKPPSVFDEKTVFTQSRGNECGTT